MKFKQYIAKCIVAGVLLFSGLVNANSVAEPVWIDVRSAQEYQVNHIEGDMRISYTQIVDGVTQVIPDKETPIRLYCRSGRRAGIAMSSLQAAGYSDVKNIGSIGNARKLRE